MFRNSNAKEDAASLLVAAEKGHVTVIGELLKRNAKNPKFLEARNTFGNTALMVAAFWGQEAVVKQLLEAKADINTRNNKDITPLMVAAVSGHVAILAELLNRKPELLEAHDSVGDTALIVAAFCGHKAVVEKLLEANAKVNVKDKEGKTAFTHAVESLVNHCLKKDATVETKENKVNSDEVSDYWQILKLLIERDADTTTTNPLTEQVAAARIINKEGQRVSLAAAIQAERANYVSAVKMTLARGFHPRGGANSPLRVLKEGDWANSMRLICEFAGLRSKRLKKSNVTGDGEAAAKGGDKDKGNNIVSSSGLR